MIPGLNTEVSRRGRSVHIQTEVAAFEAVEVVTQVFMGGVVVHTVRNVSSHLAVHVELIAAEMRQQHRDIHTSVARGQLDAKLLVRSRIVHSGIPLARSEHTLDDGHED